MKFVPVLLVGLASTAATLVIALRESAAPAARVLTHEASPKHLESCASSESARRTVSQRDVVREDLVSTTDEAREPYPIEVEIECAALEGMPLSLEVWALAEEPRALLETEDLRLLPRSLAFEFLEIECVDARDHVERIDDGELEVRGGRALLRTTLRDDDLDRAVWLCVTSESDVGGYAPRAVFVAAPHDSATPRKARLAVDVRGGLRGSIVGWSEDSDDLLAAIVFGHNELAGVRDGSLVAWPLRAGRVDGALLRAHDATFLLRSFSAEIRDGAVTDLGPIDVTSAPRTCVVRAFDGDGRSLDFELAVLRNDSDAASPRSVASLATSIEDGRAALELRGDGWERLRLSAEATSGEYEPVEFDLNAATNGRLDVTFDKRSRPTTRVVLSFADSREPSRFERPIVFSRGGPWCDWRANWTNYVGCTLRYYSVQDIPLGDSQLLIWNPSSSGAALFNLRTTVDDEDDDPWLEVPTNMSVGTLRGVLAPRVRGYPADVQLTAWIEPAGAAASPMLIHAQASSQASEVLVHRPGAFEIGGVPAELDLEFVLVERNSVVLRRPLHLEPGETLDLGTLAVELD